MDRLHNFNEAHRPRSEDEKAQAKELADAQNLLAAVRVRVRLGLGLG